MRLNTLARHLKEGFINVGRNGWMTFASVSAVTITLLVLGVFLLLAFNVNHIVDEAEDQVEIRVFLELSASDSEIEEVEDNIRNIPQVRRIDFIPKEEGLDQLKESLGERSYLLDGLEKENPLPDAFVVQTEHPQQTAEAAERIMRFEHVEDVLYGKEMVNRLFKVTSMIRYVGIAFIIGLAFTAMFLISNTIKLTIHARGTEIEIMKLVGATNAFIRWPFFIEGLLLGLLGAVIPIIILIPGYIYAYRQMESSFFYFLDMLPVFPLVYKMSFILLGIGVFIGIWGSLVSVRRFLRV